MSGDAGEEEALVFMLTSWCDIKTKKQIALRSRSQTEREPWSPEGSSSLYPPTHPGCSWLGLLLLFTAWRWCFEGKLQRKTSKREASDQASVFDTLCVTLSLLHFCCLFQYQHEKMKLFWPENCQHQLCFFAVQITTFLYRRQRWKSFDVAIVQKKKKRGQGFH